MENEGITPMENISGKPTKYSLKNHHKWGCPFYVLNEILQGNIAGLPNLEPRSRKGIYLGHSPFHSVSVALDLNPATGNVSTQLHVVFYD